MTTLQRKESNPIAHLSPEDIEEIGRELDAIRDEFLALRGEKDAAHIRRMIKIQRRLELASRATLMLSVFPPAWVLGTAGLAIAKILENMEIGHNILHGQYDFMRDSKIHSTTWEWDHASPAEQWKHSHNELHHKYTNVIGRDNDLGYGIMRVDEQQRWTKAHLGQPLYNLINALFFEYGIAAYDLELGRNLKTKKRRNNPEFRERLRAVGRKIRKQATKDYLVQPALTIPAGLAVGNPVGAFFGTMAATAIANVARNLWSHSVIICGHFPKGVETFERTSITGETRGEWYLRQMLGSANISGGKLMHIMTGNLSHQIEHHLFPDLPSSQYAQIAPKIKALFAKYELKYVSGPMVVQVASAWAKVIRLALPNPEPAREIDHSIPARKPVEVAA
ncbi:fatty acid desaturase family protein [Actinoplanes derwentensis]|uniref:Linoleoyl-CoA desaturase n=1 Tax=Actinoplanes derwentensis TaxID=113562 RepID=A0A1H1PLC2_9ACTN|nr:acyl-CoA desaturase [Actinoplanes derwentensis]GID84895.1 putative fatty acid desaturase [Actinoplanes derwentensis]SDS11855.1 linoleoyl-CoA desaturase [Actinoplanes derwentensis]